MTSGSNGYTLPNDGDTNSTFDFQEAGAVPAIIGQPTNQFVCEGGSTTFNVAATGTALSYQWQISTDGGSNFSDLSNGGKYTGVNTTTLTVSNILIGEDANQFQVIVSSDSFQCNNTTSNAAVLDVQPSATADAGTDDAFCANTTYLLDGTVTNASSITWSGSTGISDPSIEDPTYTPTAAEIAAGTVTLTLSANGIGACSADVVIDTVTLIIEAVPTITTQPTDQVVFVNNNATFNVSTSDVDTYQWQVSADGGSTFNNISDGPDYSGTQTATLTVLTPEVNQNGYRFRVIVSRSGTSCATVASNEALLTVRVSTVITNRRITFRVNKN